jgi:succinoglycan biosynthesis protein ExoM
LHLPKSDIPEIDVCVNTYNRPRLLKKLLISLDNQNTFGQFTYRVIVVDNDRQQTASAVVREIKPINYSISYAVESEKNIALARNKALNLCTGDYIATIDDDEWADKSWLLNLYQASIKYQADVVIGRTKPIFPQNTPKYIKESLFFNRDRPLSGSIVGSAFYNTGNSFFKRSIIRKTSLSFDPQFGETGGEDTRFFEDLKLKGYPAVWCDEAIVSHYYPPDRARLRWMLRRIFRYGNNARHFRRDDYWLIVESPHRIIQLMHILKSTAKFSLKFLKSILHATSKVENKSILLNYLLGVAFCIGEISSLFNYRYREYR